MKRIGWITVVLAMAVSLLARPVLAVELDIKGKSGLLMDVAEVFAFGQGEYYQMALYSVSFTSGE